MCQRKRLCLSGIERIHVCCFAFKLLLELTEQGLVREGVVNDISGMLAVTEATRIANMTELGEGASFQGDEAEACTAHVTALVDTAGSTVIARAMARLASSRVISKFRQASIAPGAAFSQHLHLHGGSYCL
jgi:hypothetical protein